MLADFRLLLGAGPERSKAGLELGGCPIGELRNLLQEPVISRANLRIKIIKNPNGDPLGF